MRMKIISKIRIYFFVYVGGLCAGLTYSYVVFNEIDISWSVLLSFVPVVVLYAVRTSGDGNSSSKSCNNK